MFPKIGTKDECETQFSLFKNGAEEWQKGMDSANKGGWCLIVLLSRVQNICPCPALVDKAQKKKSALSSTYTYRQNKHDFALLCFFQFQNREARLNC